MQTHLKTWAVIVISIFTLSLQGCGGSGSVSKQATSSGTLGATSSTATSTANTVIPVSNNGMTFELEFVDQLKLENNISAAWSDAYQKPYIDAANKWLNALLSVEGKAHHTIRMKIYVEQLDGGNGLAGPDAEESVGSFTFPTTGTMKIGNHTYANNFDQVEFHANILHEMGHIIGIGSFTENFMEHYAPLKGNVLKIENSIAAEQYNKIYNNAHKYVPLSDDGGHLYDYVLQEDKQRVLADGSILQPLTKEFMANGAIFGAVTLAVLDDIGYRVSYEGVESYTP